MKKINLNNIQVSGIMFFVIAILCTIISLSFPFVMPEIRASASELSATEQTTLITSFEKIASFTWIGAVGGFFGCIFAFVGNYYFKKQDAKQSDCFAQTDVAEGDIE
jgi:uncharacterized membrane protein